jgi:hypothetical protein
MVTGPLRTGVAVGPRNHEKGNTLTFQPSTLAALSRLGAPELNEVTGLVAQPGSHQWSAVVDAVRDAVQWGIKDNRWDDADTRPQAVHEAADWLTPTKPDNRAGEYAAIGSAWRLDLDAFAPYAKAFESWRNRDLPDLSQSTVDTAVGRSLYLSYTAAVRNVLRHMFDLEGRLAAEDTHWGLAVPTLEQ